MDLQDFFLSMGVVVVLAAAGIAAWLYFGRRHLDLDAKELVHAARVVLDVQSRAIESFVEGSLKGAQLRHELCLERLLITYSLKRVPNGIEHQLRIMVEGTLPKTLNDPRDLASLARIAVYLTHLAKLEPVDPIDVEPAARAMAVTRVLTEGQTQTMKADASQQPSPQVLVSLYERAAQELKSVWTRPPSPAKA